MASGVHNTDGHSNLSLKDVLKENILNKFLIKETAHKVTLFAMAEITDASIHITLSHSWVNKINRMQLCMYAKKECNNY